MLCSDCGSRFDLETLSRLRRLCSCRSERRLACADRKVSALVPLLASDALVSANVDGCPSTASSDVILQEGEDELELLEDCSLTSSSGVMLQEKDDELELLLRLVELLWVLWGGSELDEFTESG